MGVIQSTLTSLVYGDPQSRLTKADLAACAVDVRSLLREKLCHPLMIRLAWHDAGTYDAKSKVAWPGAGGATGSLRFQEEQGHGANAGLNAAVAMLEPIKAKHPHVSYADLFQLTGALAVEEAGGPVVPMRYGRVDADRAMVEGNLPDAKPPFKGEASPQEHLRNVFYRMGLNDQDIVALSGAHTVGRAHKSRSGTCDKDGTKYTKQGNASIVPGAKPGTKGGQSWTPEWLKFDNSYFVEVKAKRNADLLVLPTDACLFADEKFAKHANKYAQSQAAFFQEYAASHKKLSELGVKWNAAPVAYP